VWGANDDGQLGTGSSTGPKVCGVATACSAVPVIAAGIGVAMVSSGSGHACSVFTDGTVSCWGLNSSGQLGDGTTNDSPVPVAVSGIETATAVSAGSGHSCALLADGHVSCWGSNIVGELGNGTTADSPVTAPVIVSNIDTAIAISAGFAGTCALLSNGTVRCWGSNSSGQLGTGTTAPANVPVPVSGIFDAIAAVVWSSLDPSVASIGAEGVAAGTDPGTTVISAAAANFGVNGGTNLAVPEPSPGLLGMTGVLSALGLAARRRQRANESNPAPV